MDGFYEKMRASSRVRSRVLALVASILCLVLVAKTGRAASNATCLDRFLVRSGDTLIGIAAIYGFDWKVIAELNNLQQPYELFAGQWLCLPAVVGAEVAASTPHPSRRPDFSVRIMDNQVHIQTRNFPSKNSYTIKVTDNSAPSSEPWHKLGILRTKGGGEVRARFKLPNELKNSQQVLLCLKNLVTNELTCKTIANFPN